MLRVAKRICRRRNYRGECQQPLDRRLRFVEPAHIRIASGQSTMCWCERRNLLDGDPQRCQRILEAMADEMSMANPGQMETPLTARIETHRGLEMLNRQIGLAGKQAQPAAPIPAKGKAWIEREGAIDQGKGRIDILAETAEHYGCATKDTRVVGGDAQGLTGKINRRVPVFLFSAMIGPIVVFEVDPVGRRQGKSRTVTRLASDRLIEQVERL